MPAMAPRTVLDRPPHRFVVLVLALDGAQPFELRIPYRVFAKVEGPY